MKRFFLLFACIAALTGMANNKNQPAERHPDNRRSMAETLSDGRRQRSYRQTSVPGNCRRMAQPERQTGQRP